MLLLPLSFLSLAYLWPLCMRMLRKHRDGDRSATVFSILLALLMAQSVLAGLRWGFGWTHLQLPMALTAVCIPATAWLAYRSLFAEALAWRQRDCWHAVSVGALALAWFAHSAAVDWLLFALFMGYGVALWRRGMQGEDGMLACRLDTVMRSMQSLRITAVVLMVSALSDAVVSLDMAWNTGANAAWVVSLQTTVVVLLLAWASSRLDTAPSDTPAPRAPVAPARPVPLQTSDEAPTDTAQTMQAIDSLLQGQRFFTDAELNLSRLAKRLGLPARAVSHTINRCVGVSVSQYVNQLRIAEACRLLRDTDEAITHISYAAGFMSKSNFNREFARITGQTPSQWRNAQIKQVADWPQM